MENYTVKVKYKDGSFTWVKIEASNFGEACMKIYNNQINGAFVSGFERRTF